MLTDPTVLFSDVRESHVTHLRSNQSCAGAEEGTAWRGQAGYRPSEGQVETILVQGWRGRGEPESVVAISALQPLTAGPRCRFVMTNKR